VSFTPVHATPVVPWSLIGTVTLFPQDAVMSVGMWSVLAGLAPIAVRTVGVAFSPVMPDVVVVVVADAEGVCCGWC